MSEFFCWHCEDTGEDLSNGSPCWWCGDDDAEWYEDEYLDYVDEDDDDGMDEIWFCPECHEAMSEDEAECWVCAARLGTDPAGS